MYRYSLVEEQKRNYQSYKEFNILRSYGHSVFCNCCLQKLTIVPKTFIVHVLPPVKKPDAPVKLCAR